MGWTAGAADVTCFSGIPQHRKGVLTVAYTERHRYLALKRG